ncbi:MAG: hypothetical protein KBD78_03515 [Oligoflexales bacterium]|nr:hypothetical protein [Oligoflexales bacterium]
MRIFGTIVTAAFLSNAAMASDIEKIWSTGCQTVQQGGSFLGFEIYEAGNFTVGSVEFDDAQCSFPGMTNTLIGTYSESTVNGNNAIDKTYNQHLMTWFDKGLVAYLETYIKDGKDTQGQAQQILDGYAAFITELNDMEFCGYTDWTIGDAKDVTGATCVYVTVVAGAVQGYPVPTLAGPATEYNIYKVDAGYLYIGEASQDFDTTTADKRPTTLAKDPSYIEVPVEAPVQP